MRISIDDILALDAKDFMEFVEPMNFQETKNLKVLLDIELERAKILYEQFKEAGNQTKATAMRVNVVLIRERIGICNYYLSKRGIDLSIFK